MADAVYWVLHLNCPNDYTNDEAICQAIVGMLGQIGVMPGCKAKGPTLPYDQE